MLTIEHPLTGAKLQVANKDFSVEMTWLEAKRACEELGNGWRLPSLEELDAIHRQLRLNGIGNIKKANYWGGYNYWSSAEYNASSAYIIGFEDGDCYGKGYSEKDDKNYVRAVRAF